MRIPDILPVLFLLATTYVHAQTTRTWETYAPKEIPEGKKLYLEEAAELVNGGVKETTYVIGPFTVTAAGVNRIVLRSEPPTRTRLLVEFPEGIKTPAEQTKVSRGSDNPYLVTDVRKGADGQVTVYAREVVRE